MWFILVLIPNSDLVFQIWPFVGSSGWSLKGVNDYSENNKAIFSAGCLFESLAGDTTNSDCTVKV